MLAYLVRRLLYAIPILIGVNLITFALFFIVNTPDDMARMQLGVKRVTAEAIAKWKVERGYDKPLFINAQAEGAGVLTDTIFFAKSARMFVGDFGRAEDGRDIAREITTRMGPSLAIALPTFILGLVETISFALLLAFFRASPLDFWGVVLCVALMSISGLFYIIGGQFLISKLWRLVPISGYSGGLDAWKFLILPVLIAASNVAVAASGNALTAVLAYAAAGFACSAMLPLSLSLAGQEFPRLGATSSGELIAGYQVGYGITAFGVAPLQSLTGISMGGIYLIGAGIAVALAVVARMVTAGRARHPATP